MASFTLYFKNIDAFIYANLFYFTLVQDNLPEVSGSRSELNSEKCESKSVPLVSKLLINKSVGIAGLDTKNRAYNICICTDYFLSEVVHSYSLRWAPEVTMRKFLSR